MPRARRSRVIRAAAPGGRTRVARVDRVAARRYGQSDRSDRRRPAGRTKPADVPGRARGGRRPRRSPARRCIGSSVSQAGRAPTIDLRRRAGRRPRASVTAEQLQRQRSAGTGGRVRRHAGAQVRRDHERPGADEASIVPARRCSDGEGMVGEGPIGVDARSPRSRPSASDSTMSIRSNAATTASSGAHEGRRRRSPAGRSRAARAAARSATRRRSSQPRCYPVGAALGGPARSPVRPPSRGSPGLDIEADVDAAGPPARDRSGPRS